MTKFFIAEGVLIVGMIATFVYQQLPPVTLTVGDATVTIKADPITTEDRFAASALLPSLPPLPLPTTIEPRAEAAAPPAGASGATLHFPVAGHDPAAIISTFGDRRGSSRLHQGVDIGAPRGTAVVAVADGFIERIKDGGRGGKQLYLRDARGRLYYYAHLDSWSVAEYDAVRAGDVLGTVGDTGNAQGTTPHLHFEVLLGKQRRAVDPLTYWRRGA